MDKYVVINEAPVCFAETDVLVCGAGPAGIGAALRAGRMGAKMQAEVGE